MEEQFIRSQFHVRYCYKYRGNNDELCKCGKRKNLHSNLISNKEDWSLDNNTDIKPCDTFGSIQLLGYDDVSIDHNPKFIRFNCKNEDTVNDNIYKLIVEYWKFPIPRLIISVNGGFKRMNFKTNQQKKNFKQGLIEVMKKETTWIIGGGFNVGIHKLVGEAVNEYRLHHEGNKDKVKLIGISTWGVVRNNEYLVSRINSNNKSSSDLRLYKYANINTPEKGKVTLDPHYDCFLFCDDGTEKQYDKEIEFRLNFEKYVQNRDNASAVQILYEGGKRALENAHRTLSKSVPLVVIKGSGRAANIISDVMEMDKKNYSSTIILKLQDYRNELQLEFNEMERFHNNLVEMYSVLRSQIVIHDILDKNMKLDKKILEAIIPSQEDTDLGKSLSLSIRFNCHEIAKTKIFHHPNFQNIKVDTLKENIKEAIKKNRPEFLRLFLDNNIEFDTCLDEELIIELYNESLIANKSRCADLLSDLISYEDKTFKQKQLIFQVEHMFKIFNVICKLSNNILDCNTETGLARRSSKYSSGINDDVPDLAKRASIFSPGITNDAKGISKRPSIYSPGSNNSSTGLSRRSSIYSPGTNSGSTGLSRPSSKLFVSFHDDITDRNFPDFELKNPLIKTSVYQITYKDLFLWAILSGHIQMAMIFWEISRDHIGSALVASILLNRLGSLILNRGDRDTSEKLIGASNKFQEMASMVLMEAYKSNPSKAYTLLIRRLKRWNKMTCLNIAISGNLLEFLNNSACRSYTRKAWMGDLSQFLPTWKILVTIPLSFILIKPLIIPTFFHKHASSLDLYDEFDSETSCDAVDGAVHVDKDDDSEDISFKNPQLNYNIKKHSTGDVTFKEAIKMFYEAPYVKFIIHLILYIFFLLIFAYLILVELRPLTIHSGTNMSQCNRENHQSKLISSHRISAEIYVYFYIFGFIVEEIRQVKHQERSRIIYKMQTYFSKSWNIFDVSIFSFSFLSTILRFTISCEYFALVRCAYAVTFSIFCLRMMQFYFINRSIGPKVIMIRKMLFDIFFFLSIFILFIISYGTLVQSLKNPNSNLTVTLIKDIFYKPYFQTYGELMLGEFDFPEELQLVDTIKYVVMYIGFAIFLLLSNILLINLLIAMFGHTFNQIQGESEKVFSFIQIQLVEEFHAKSMFPPPLNIFYYFIRLIIRACYSRHGSKFRYSDGFLTKDLSQGDDVKMTGYEQLCMEFSMMKSPFSEKQSASKTDYAANVHSRLDKIESLLEQIMKSSKHK